jgi:hypothetical protein
MWLDPHGSLTGAFPSPHRNLLGPTPCGAAQAIKEYRGLACQEPGVRVCLGRAACLLTSMFMEASFSLTGRQTKAIVQMHNRLRQQKNVSRHPAWDTGERFAAVNR